MKYEINVYSIYMIHLLESVNKTENTKAIIKISSKESRSGKALHRHSEALKPLPKEQVSLCTWFWKRLNYLSGTQGRWTKAHEEYYKMLRKSKKIKSSDVMHISIEHLLMESASFDAWISHSSCTRRHACGRVVWGHIAKRVID